MIYSFLLGVLGGCLIDFYDFYETRKVLAWPEYLKTCRYWIPTILMILVGGALAAQVSNASPLACIQIGASTPLLISRFLKEKEVE